MILTEECKVCRGMVTRLPRIGCRLCFEEHREGEAHATYCSERCLAYHKAEVHHVQQFTVLRREDGSTVKGMIVARWLDGVVSVWIGASRVIQFVHGATSSRGYVLGEIVEEVSSKRHPSWTSEDLERRAMEDVELQVLAASLREALEVDGIDLRRSTDERAQTLKDVECVLRRRANNQAAESLMKSSGDLIVAVHRIAREMVEAHAEHAGNARNALRSVIYGDLRAGRDMRETFDAWNDRYEVLEDVCVALPAEEKDPVVVALRAVYEDREEPIYGWTEGDSESEARAAERMSRYYGVWRELERVVGSS